MNEAKALLSLVQAFFQEYLAGQRGLSQNTIFRTPDIYGICSAPKTKTSLRWVSGKIVSVALS